MFSSLLVRSVFLLTLLLMVDSMFSMGKIINIMPISGVLLTHICLNFLPLLALILFYEYDIHQ